MFSVKTNLCFSPNFGLESFGGQTLYESHGLTPGTKRFVSTMGIKRGTFVPNNKRWFSFII